MELMALVYLVILSKRDFVGMVRVERLTLWSDIGEKVWSTEESRAEVVRVMTGHFCDHSHGWKRKCVE